MCRTGILSAAARACEDAVCECSTCCLFLAMSLPLESGTLSATGREHEAAACSCSSLSLIQLYSCPSITGTLSAAGRGLQTVACICSSSASWRMATKPTQQLSSRCGLCRCAWGALVPGRMMRWQRSLVSRLERLHQTAYGWGWRTPALCCHHRQVGTSPRVGERKRDALSHGQRSLQRACPDIPSQEMQPCLSISDAAAGACSL